ncbi:MAG TPA: hypothetical protein PLF11_14185 [Bacillota bacterium]|nr:hypothetical protein [Bacillota bacterium]
MRRPRSDFRLTYPTGEEVRENDRVLALDRPAVVEAVFGPGTKMARDTCYGSEGGFVLQFEDGDRQVWPNTEDRIALVARG